MLFGHFWVHTSLALHNAIGISVCRILWFWVGWTGVKVHGLDIRTEGWTMERKCAPMLLIDGQIVLGYGCYSVVQWSCVLGEI